MPILKNRLLRVEIKQKGAELCSIRSQKNNTEFMWQANPKIWASHAPNLFPIIGALKDNSYYYNDQLYKMPKHGFVRHNEDLSVILESETKVTFSLKSNAELKAIYPFDFEFLITYELKDNALFVNHTVKNTDHKTMYFSLGGHPAFNCTSDEETSYTDYFLEFEKEESSQSYLLNMDTGLVTKETKAVFNTPNTINLNNSLFNEDALIFKDVQSRKVTLKHINKGTILSVKFEGFPFLGIWAKPNAPYVCIEPWIGVADSETTNQKITEKEGVISLNPNNNFTATYSIEIEKTQIN
ncbi:aldose 1-epimerase family protein [Winogradskyella sp.]|jgi:galactose mutarotase-like enzyme|uniref:aldose 1-epimerase family protein n=1 Tax=Winogradskyella sp. TaxID=1883156 RepID=UPI0025D3E754|nr:aldose 1-epimerase family protein [Winogradskyella sp.]MCT4628536.1 aldose 1-epimerase family protein [Winogradskyella sp.]